MKITDETIRTALTSKAKAPQNVNMRLYSEFSAFRPKRSRLTYAAILGIPAAAVLLGAGVYTVHNGGYFKDVKNGFRAVTSTEYKDATEEIQVSARAEGSVIKLHLDIPKLKMTPPDSFPYSEFDVIRVSGCTVECGGKKVKVADMPCAELGTDSAQLEILLAEELPVGEECTLTITSFEGSKKADQPLPIYGNWKIKMQ